jgi:hypothetical protein
LFQKEATSDSEKNPFAENKGSKKIKQDKDLAKEDEAENYRKSRPLVA